MVNTSFPFFSLPHSMRFSYLRNVADHFFPEANLFHTLRYFFNNRPRNEIQSAIRKAAGSSVVANIVVKQGETNGTFSKWKLVCLGSFIRLMKPKIVVETGVAHGSSSATILEALHENGFGELYSIDLPVLTSRSGELEPWLGGRSFKVGDVSTVRDLNQVGWLVSPHLRDRWKLVLGDSLEKLPEILPTLSGVDFFLHDSLHHYEHMRREFELVWPFLKQKGFILADDIFIKRHSAIHDFAVQNGEQFKNYLQLGLIRKTRNANGSN